MALEHKEKAGNADLNGSSPNVKVSNADLCGNCDAGWYWKKRKGWQRRPKWKLTQSKGLQG